MYSSPHSSVILCVLDVTFSWDEYLKENDGEPAPELCFKQVRVTTLDLNRNKSRGLLASVDVFNQGFNESQLLCLPPCLSIMLLCLLYIFRTPGWIYMMSRCAVCMFYQGQG